MNRHPLNSISHARTHGSGALEADLSDAARCFSWNRAADRTPLDEETEILVRCGNDKMHTVIAHSCGHAIPNQTQQTTNTRATVVLTTYSGLRVTSRAEFGAGMQVVTKEEVCLPPAPIG
jgi:hypothetical protein